MMRWLFVDQLMFINEMGGIMQMINNNINNEMAVYWSADVY